MMKYLTKKSLVLGILTLAAASAYAQLACTGCVCVSDGKGGAWCHCDHCEKQDLQTK